MFSFCIRQIQTSSRMVFLHTGLQRKSSTSFIYALRSQNSVLAHWSGQMLAKCCSGSSITQKCTRLFHNHCCFYIVSLVHCHHGTHSHTLGHMPGTWHKVLDGRVLCQASLCCPPALSLLLHPSTALTLTGVLQPPVTLQCFVHWLGLEISFRACEQDLFGAQVYEKCIPSLNRNAWV